MTDEELAEIEKSVKMLDAMGMTWKSRDMCRLIAEARRLRAEAETIEVLREWIRKCGQKLIADEREIIENAEFSSPEDLLEAKRRIAALEGK